MKKTVLLTLATLLFSAAIFAQTMPNYSGNWKLNESVSKSQKDLTSEKYLTIRQNNDEVEVFKFLPYVQGTNKIQRTSEVFKINKNVAISTAMPNAEKEELTVKVFLNSSNNLQISKTSRKNIEGKMQNKTEDETWQLSADRKKLTIKGIDKIEGASAKEYELIYEKLDTNLPARIEEKTINGGVINGKAISLVKPGYPKEAREEKAEGAVSVKVIIDEEGNIISAKAISGHPALFQVSEEAAKLSKFSPTILSGQKVKVTGVIVYNFTRM